MVDVDADRSTRRAKKVAVLVVAVLVTGLMTSGSVGAETRAKAGSKTMARTYAENDGVYQATVDAPTCNTEGANPEYRLHQVELTVAANIVTTVFPEYAMPIPPGPVDANGAFSVSYAQSGATIVVSGTFNAGHVEGQIESSAGGFVCAAAFAGERV